MIHGCNLQKRNTVLTAWKKKSLSCRSAGNKSLWLSYSLDFLTFYVELHAWLVMSLALHSLLVFLSKALNGYVNGFIFDSSLILLNVSDFTYHQPFLRT